MNLPTTNMVEVVVALVMGMYATALLLAFYRLARGPSLPDRVVAADLISTLTLGFLAVESIYSEEPLLLSVVMALALLAFLGTVAFAVYVRRGGKP